MAKSTKGAKRIKAAAALWVPGTREEVIEGTRLLGDAQRELVRAETEMNDAEMLLPDWLKLLKIIKVVKKI